MNDSGHKPRVAFQGEHGAFSEEAAIKLLGPAIELVPRRTFAELFSSVEEGRAEYVLAPIENSLAGPVQTAVDLLRESALVVAQEVVIRVEQHLIGCSGAVFEEIEAVESHPVALAQCKRFFAANPQIMKIESDDTAGSVARIVARGDCGRAAIAGRRAAGIYGGSIIRENLEDDRENYTRFLLLSRHGKTISRYGTERGSDCERTPKWRNRIQVTSQVRKEGLPPLFDALVQL